MSLGSLIEWYIKEQAGPYGPAIREKEKEFIDWWLKNTSKPPREGDTGYPVFPPGIFGPSPKGIGGIDDQLFSMSGQRKDVLGQMANEVLGEDQPASRGRDERPFNIG